MYALHLIFFCSYKRARSIYACTCFLWISNVVCSSLIIYRIKSFNLLGAGKCPCLGNIFTAGIDYPPPAHGHEVQCANFFYQSVSTQLGTMPGGITPLSPLVILSVHVNRHLVNTGAYARLFNTRASEMYWSPVPTFWKLWLKKAFSLAINFLT